MSVESIIAVFALCIAQFLRHDRMLTRIGSKVDAQGARLEHIERWVKPPQENRYPRMEARRAQDHAEE